MTPLKAGDIAPKFSLPDQDGEEVNLTDFQGQRVLVYFYPKAMTPGCTVQACGLRDNMDDLKKAGVEVLGISTDKPEKLSRFAEKELLNLVVDRQTIRPGMHHSFNQRGQRNGEEDAPESPQSAKDHHRQDNHQRV